MNAASPVLSLKLGVILIPILLLAIFFVTALVVLAARGNLRGLLGLVFAIGCCVLVGSVVLFQYLGFHTAFPAPPRPIEFADRIPWNPDADSPFIPVDAAPPATQLAELAKQATKAPPVIPVVASAPAPTAKVEAKVADPKPAASVAPAESKAEPKPEPAREPAKGAERVPAGQPLSTPIGAGEEHVVAPPRPPWVDAEPVLAGDALRMPLCSGPFERLRECRRALDAKLQKAVDEYVDDYFQDDYGDRLRPSELLNYDVNYIKSHLVGKEQVFEELVQVSFGRMYQTHALLVLDASFRKELESRREDLESRCRDAVAMRRLALTGLGFGLLLGVLGIGRGYLRLTGPTGRAATCAAGSSGKC